MALAALGVLGARAPRVGRRRLGIALQIVAFIAVVAVGVQRHPRAAGGPAAPPPAGPARTVVLVTGDTLRRDHVSAYPEARVPGLTPNLEALAAEGLRFDDATAPAPLTLPVHTSLLTGLLPLEHGVLDNGSVLQGEPEAAPAQMRQAGWRTAAFTGSSVVHGSHGLARWFEVYRDDLGPDAGRRDLVLVRAWDGLVSREPRLVKERGDRTVARALRWLGEQDAASPAFLWVHLYDAHAPHEAHPELGPVPSARDALPSPCDYASHPSASHTQLLGFMRALMRDTLRPEGCATRDWSGLYGRVDAYAREVRFVDQQVGALVEGLKRLSRWDGTSLLFLADHGESLTEHSQWVSHQYVLYDTVIRVPVILRPAGGVAPRGVSAPVTSVQVASTLARLAGLDPAPGMAGPDLLAVAAGATDSPAQLATAPAQRRPGSPREERPMMAAIRSEGRKVLLSTEAPPERYELGADPGELLALQRADEQVVVDPSPRREGARVALVPLTGSRSGPRPGQLATEEQLAPFAPLEQQVRAALSAAVARAGARVGPDPGLPEDVRESLEALGYLQ